MRATAGATRGFSVEELRRDAEFLLRTDVEELAARMEASPTEYWYLLPPDDLHAVVSRMPARVFARRPLAALLYEMCTGSAPGGLPIPQVDAASGIRERIAAGLRMRLHGRYRDAWRVLQEADHSSHAARFSFAHHLRGRSALFALESGVTAMLAGDFAEALAMLAHARFWRVAPHLRFIERSAHAHAAVVHALVGDSLVARAEVEAARLVPRTASWIEPRVDAALRIAERALRDGVATTMPLVMTPDIGEMWPFAVWTSTTRSLVEGHVAGAESLLALVARMGMPGAQADGVPGAVLPALTAMTAGARGEHARTVAMLDDAAAGGDLTRFARAYVAMSGDDLDAMRDASHGLAETMAPLRAARILAASMGAAAALRSGDADAAREILRADLTTIRPLDDRERAQLLPDALELFATLSATPPPAEAAPRAAAELSARERELLILLAAHESRRQIAQAQFVSLNTVKTRLRLLYRTLGVSTRDEALAEARRRGIL